MYQSIASVYDYIFPQNMGQLKFIEGVKPIDKKEEVLEIGCATGNLTELLASKSDHVMGLDLDSGLLDVAHYKYPNMNFVHENMLHLENLNKSFDRIVCFGNTLVHLPNRQDVRLFFKKVYHQLKDDGYLLVQIINYDRIVDQNIGHLPTIENDHITFVRDYDIKSDHVLFQTKLLIKESQTLLSNEIPLLTLRKEEIQTYLEAVGFKDIKFYGNLKGDPLSNQDIPLLFSCKK